MKKIRNKVSFVGFVILFFTLPFIIEAQTRLRDGRSANGNLRQGGTVSFSYTPIADGVLAIEITGNVNVIIEIFNNQNKKLNDFDDNIAFGNRIFLEVERNKIYRFDVKGATNNDNGRFSIIATFGAEPNTAEEFRIRGNYFRFKENTNRALSDFNRAIAINPQFARAYFNRAAIYMQTHTEESYRRAISDLERALNIDPNFIRAADANVFLGMLYYDLGEGKSKAMNFINRALNIDPKNEIAINAISIIEQHEVEARAKEAAAQVKLELQNRINTQFGFRTSINKSLYEEVSASVGIAVAMGMSPFQSGRRYMTPVIMGVNTNLGASFAGGGIAFIDTQKRVSEELMKHEGGFIIYFTFNRITRDGAYINLEFIELL